MERKITSVQIVIRTTGWYEEGDVIEFHDGAKIKALLDDDAGFLGAALRHALALPDEPTAIYDDADCPHDHTTTDGFIRCMRHRIGLGHRLPADVKARLLLSLEFARRVLGRWEAFDAAVTRAETFLRQLAEDDVVFASLSTLSSNAKTFANDIADARKAIGGQP